LEKIIEEKPSTQTSYITQLLLFVKQLADLIGIFLKKLATDVAFRYIYGASELQNPSAVA
jgi:hypothetical protein